MREDGKVRPEGCICEPCSDINRCPKSWRNGLNKKELTGK